MPDAIAVAHGHTAIMLALTGMRVDEVADASEAEDALATHLDSEIALIIVQEEFRPGFTEAFQERLTRHHGLPLIVYCPSFDKEDSEVDIYLAQVLKPAIGYEIRLE